MANQLGGYWKLAETIKGIIPSKDAKPTTAVVRNIDPDGTVWVAQSGSDDLVPVTGINVASVSVDDVVMVDSGNGRLSITGNASEPAVGERTVNTTAQQVVNRAAYTLGAATAAVQAVADEAKAVAEATNQHFFTDTNGIHVTEVTQEEWESEQTGLNVLINSSGQLFRNALKNLVSITSSATAFYDGVANAAANVVAQFGSFGAIIGKVASSHFAQTATGATFFGTNGTDKNLSIETDNGVGVIKFNGDRSSINGFANILGLRSYGSSSSSDNGMITITAESEDVDTATGSVGQTYLWMYSAQSNAHAELESVDGNGGMASVRVDGKNSEVDITGDLKLVNNVLAKAYGGTGNTSGAAAKLVTPRTLYVALGTTYDSTNPVQFDGSANKALPVSGTLPVARGGTGGTTAAAARSNLAAAARSWTQLDTSTNDAAMTYDLSNYYEVMFVARAGTNYVGSVVLPKAHLSTTAREVYLSGGSNSSSGGRGFAVTATSTKATPAARKVDGTTTACTWWTYAR